MLLSKLYEWDSSLTLQNSSEFLGNVEGITTSDFPRANHLMFIKEKKFFERLYGEMQKSPLIFKEMGLIVQKNFFEREEKTSQFREVIKNLAWVMTTPSVPLSMCRLSDPFYHQKLESIVGKKSQIHASAQIAPDVAIGDGIVIEKNVTISSHCTIMSGSTIKEGTTLFPNVTVYPFVTIGKKCRVHSGTVIGSDGFGYHFHQGAHHKIWQMGGVVIGDEVELGSCVCVDAGTFIPTTVGNGCKIDNFVQIAHNCILGQGVIMCGHSGLAGSCHIGDFCVFGGRSGCAPDITLGMGCQIAGGALIGCDWPANSVLGGHPARPLKEWMRGLAYLRKESLKSHGNPEAPSCNN